jgi:hypothetical protein
VNAMVVSALAVAMLTVSLEVVMALSDAPKHMLYCVMAFAPQDPVATVADRTWSWTMHRLPDRWIENLF